MSTYGFCDGGGIDGIRITSSEMQQFAQRTGYNADGYRYIPLAGHDATMQQEILSGRFTCPVNHNLWTENPVAAFAHSEALYWEDENNRHGWCCPNCGMVVQWG